MVQDAKDQVSSNIGSSLFIPVENISTKAAQDEDMSKGHKSRREEVLQNKGHVGK